MQEKTWTIVQLLDDTSVEAVPSTWVQGDLCHWPSFSKPKLYNAIRKSEPLNTHWPSHRVKIFRNGTFDDYGKARQKAKVAEEKSDLTSDTNDDRKAKRKIFARILSSSESDLDSSGELSLPVPPKIKRYAVGSLSTEQKQDTEIQNNDKENTTPQRKSGEQATCIQTNSVLNYNTDTIFTPGQTSSLKTFCISCKDKDKNLKVVIEQNHVLRSLVPENLQEVRKLRTDLLQKYDSQSEPTETFFNKFPDLNFPINNLEGFQKLEDVLKDVDFENAVKEIAKLGGCNTYNFVKRSMTTLMTNEIALQFSFLGRKGKKAFHNTRTLKLIVAAAEKASITQSQSEVEVAVATWLRRASDRRASLQKKFANN